MNSRTWIILLSAALVLSFAYKTYFYVPDPAEPKPEASSEKAAVQNKDTKASGPSAPLPDLPDAKIDTLYGVITIISWDGFKPGKDGKVQMETRIGAAHVERAAGVVKTKSFFTLKLPPTAQDSIQWVRIPSANVAEFYVWPQSNK